VVRWLRSLCTLAVAVAAGAFSLGACGSGGADTAPASAAGVLPLRLVADMPLPGQTARFDYQSIDPQRHRLFIANLGADAITVIDTRRRRVIAEIKGIPSAHGVLAVPALHRVFVTATATNQIVTLDDYSYRVIRRAPTGAFPDGLAFDGATKRIFVSDKNGSSVTVADARSGRRIATVDVGGGVGNVQYDAGSRRILVNVQTRGELAQIDPRSLRVLSRIRLRGCAQNHGLLVDAPRRLAFVACERNARLLVVDLARRVVVASFVVGDAPDVLAFDRGLRRLYVAAESGVVTVLGKRGGRHVLLGRALLAPGAHSVAVDPRTHLVYFPLANASGVPILRVMTPTPY
jgi:DNA-binding beta-propeller fold protein YncE